MRTLSKGTLCICGVKKPTVQEAERFYAADVALYGGHVLGVYPIDLNTARACYDFERADRWPVYPLPVHNRPGFGQLSRTFQEAFSRLRLWTQVS